MASMVHLTMPSCRKASSAVSTMSCRSCSCCGVRSSGRVLVMVATAALRLRVVDMILDVRR